MIKKLALKNFLSFGSAGIEVELGPLNVLIGANGSGKSNFIEAVRLLTSTPNDIARSYFQGASLNDLAWKGSNSPGKMSIEADVELYPENIRHTIFFTNSLHHLVPEEMIAVISGENPRVIYDHEFALSFDQIERTVRSKDNTSVVYEKEDLDSVSCSSSILFQLRDPKTFPYLSSLSNKYSSVRFFAESSMGRLVAARKPQDTALSQEFLFEDASNLALVLNDLQNRPQIMRTIVDRLKLFYARAENINTYVNGGTVQVFIDEGLEATIPATRLSDGTLRYLCLLVILCHPNPPPLICIEEPELGMHPDIISTIGELLIDASKRTQLIVTTHSDLLVSALRDIPESVLVCDYTNDGTTIKHLDQEDIDSWLQDYSLGEAWLKGAFGGTRW